MEAQPPAVRRRPVWRFAAIVAGLLVLTVYPRLATASTHPEDADAASGAPAEWVAGVAMGGPWTWLEPHEQARDLDRVAALGVDGIRVSFPWSAIEKQPGRFDWRTHDTIVRLAHERGLRLLANVAYTPRWARLPLCFSIKCAPAIPDRFAAFVRRVVQRYGAYGLEAVEIWNEPNIEQHWRPKPDARAYTDLLVRSYAAAKDADEAVTVVTGGLAPAEDDSRSKVDPLEFLRHIYAAGGQGSFDAVGAHPYTFPRPPLDPHARRGFGQLDLVHDLMERHGDGDKRVWVTEFGYWTSDAAFLRPPTSVTPEQQAAYLREAYDAAAARTSTGPLIWYALRDEAPNPLGREDSFGILRHDGTPKPAATVLRSILAGLAD